MTIVDIGKGQQIRIPALKLSNGETFLGSLKISDGETMIIELPLNHAGRIPDKLEKIYALAWESDGIQRSCQFRLRGHSARELVGQLIVQERRESPRLRLDMDLQYELIAPEHVGEVGEEVLSRVLNSEDTSFESNRLLRTGDDPLDQLREEIVLLRELVHDLIGQVADLKSVVSGEQRGAERLRQPLAVINCSSSGVGFITAQPITGGQCLRLRLRLRMSPPLQIEALGNVVRCAPLPRQPGDTNSERYDIGVTFTHIHESDRERLIHCLFKAQRRLLRDRHDAREAMSEMQ